MLAAKTISTVVPKEHSVASFGAPRVSVCRVPQCVLPLLSVSFVERPALRDSVVVCAAPASSSQTAPPQRAYKKKVKKQVDINGQVVKDLGNGMFSLKLENGVKVIAHLSGRIRQARIKIVLGDTVTVELSPYDLTKGRITLMGAQGSSPVGGVSI
eukprot:gene12213-15344_t